MTTAEAFAPAKVNLALHVTGQRHDGYHLLDSLVMFAEIGDHLSVRLADRMALHVTGPMAAGVPQDARNLCWKAAELACTPVEISLDKHVPSAAGIGGGSSDAAATLRAIATLTGRDLSKLETDRLGADIPVCRIARAARFVGTGAAVTPVDLPSLAAVLVNPRVALSTSVVFGQLADKRQAPISAMPRGGSASDLIAWLGNQRNDLEAPAIAAAPVVADCLDRLAALPDARLARMSGSGATCFALFDTVEKAVAATAILERQEPDWWIRQTRLS